MSTAHDDAVDRAGAPTEALAVPTVEPTKALLAKMFETIENIGKAEDHLQRKIDAELATAEKFDAAGEEREALQCIEKKEMYEQQLATLGTSRIDLVNQKLTLESMKMNAEILDALRVAAKSIQKQIKEMGGVDKEEELMDEVEDVHTRGVSILSELISGMISELIMLDGELQCLEKKEKYEQRLTTLGTSKILLEYQKMILEKHAVHEHELNDFAALREAKKAMQKQGQSSLLGILRGWVKKIGGVDEVEELMDRIEELIDKCLKDLRTPISDLMLQYGIDADDDELLAELDRLMEEELAADLSMVDLGIAVEIPSAQKRGSKAGFLEQLRKRIMGVARPVTMMDDDEELLMGADLSKVDLGIAVEMPSAQKCGGKAGFHKQLRKRIMGVARPMMSQRAIINVVGSASLEAEHEDSMAYANRLVSIEVVNHEIERFKKAVEGNPRYVDVLEALVFKKEMIEMNVQCGMLSLPQYLDGLREAMAADKIRYKDKGDKVAGTHFEIMTKELKEAEENL
jgi:hypothetical protein